jgi:hypothetical protein
MTNFENANAMMDAQMAHPSAPPRSCAQTESGPHFEAVLTRNWARSTRQQSTNGILRKLLKTNNRCHLHSTVSKGLTTYIRAGQKATKLAARIAWNFAWNRGTGRPQKRSESAGSDDIIVEFPFRLRAHLILGSAATLACGADAFSFVRFGAEKRTAS